MVGAVLLVVHPSSIWVHLAVTAVIDFTFFLKEGCAMKKASIIRERNSWFQFTKNGIISSWENHLPSRS